jgi:hypothetical protein
MATLKRSPARDSNGQLIRRWARVRFLKASAALLRGLPKADQRAILGAVGSVYRVAGLNVVGHAELEFFDSSGSMHFVWVEPENLRLVRPRNRASGSHLTARSRGTRARAARAAHRER